jgi:hypothetical protein
MWCQTEVQIEVSRSKKWSKTVISSEKTSRNDQNPVKSAISANVTVNLTGDPRKQCFIREYTLFGTEKGVWNGIPREKCDSRGPARNDQEIGEKVKKTDLYRPLYREKSISNDRPCLGPKSGSSTERPHQELFFKPDFHPRLPEMRIANRGVQKHVSFHPGGVSPLVPRDLYRSSRIRPKVVRSTKAGRPNPLIFAPISEKRQVWPDPFFTGKPGFRQMLP